MSTPFAMKVAAMLPFAVAGTADGRIALERADSNLAASQQAQTALRDLTGRLLRAQDEERRRIARDLHDSTCQNLLAASWTLNRIAPYLREGGAPLLGEVRTALNDCMRELRTLSYLLHPPFLEECGLPTALREYLNGFSQRSGIAVELILAPDIGRLAPEIESALFRIVQESLTNVHRHSGSSAARVRLTRANGRVALNVSDRGCGVAPAGRGGDRPMLVGVGIAGMRARVRQLGGRLVIRSGAWGTVVRVLIPDDAGLTAARTQRALAES